MADSPTPPDGINNRVTLAIINTTLAHLVQEQRETRETICVQLRDHETRLRDIEQWCGVSHEKWDKHAEEHRNLNVKNTALDIIGSVAAAVLGIAITKPQ